MILDSARIWVKAIRAREPLPTTEAEYVPSRIVAPAGLFPTAAERALLAGADGGAVTERGRRFERDRDREVTRTGREP